MSRVKTLREFIDDICRPRGFYGKSSFKRPKDISEELLNEKNDWYTIGIPDGLIILRESDVPKGDYGFSEIKPFIVAFVPSKTAKEYFDEIEGAQYYNG